MDLYFPRFSCFRTFVLLGARNRRVFYLAWRFSFFAMSGLGSKQLIHKRRTKNMHAFGFSFEFFSLRVMIRD